MNPTFGCDIKRQLFENITEETQQNVINSIVEAVNTFMPEIQINDIVVSPDIDFHAINVTIDYQIIISNSPGQVTIQFETIT